MLLLGINLGRNRNLRQFVLSLNFRTLLVPFATVSGTLLFCLLYTSTSKGYRIEDLARELKESHSATWKKH